MGRNFISEVWNAQTTQKKGHLVEILPTWLKWKRRIFIYFYHTHYIRFYSIYLALTKNLSWKYIYIYIYGFINSIHLFNLFVYWFIYFSIYSLFISITIQRKAPHFSFFVKLSEYTHSVILLVRPFVSMYFCSFSLFSIQIFVSFRVSESVCLFVWLLACSGHYIC